MGAFILKRSGLLLFILLLILVYFPAFLHLGYMPIRIWDESILGVNALAMAHNHNYIVTYFYGWPDMYRCKPPLMLWCIILCTKLFGFSEFTLRLPSAIGVVALCIYLFCMLKKITGNYLFGFFAVCVLITCQGYIGIHITRTGEYDSLWILFSTIFSLNLFLAVEAEDNRSRSKHLCLFFIFLTLGVLTKGLGCMLQQAPGLFIYVLIRKKWMPFLKDPALYVGLVFFCVFGLGYYFLRETMNAGYIKAVWQHEIVKLWPGVNAGKDLGLELDGALVMRYPFIFYLKRMVAYQFVEYIFIFPVALFIGLKYTGPRIKKLIWFATINGFSFFILITLGSKKVPHFNGPLFVYLAIIIASFFYVLYAFIKKQLLVYNVPPNNAYLIAFLCMLVLLGKPYYDIVKTVYFPKDNWEGEFTESCRFFQQAAKGHVDAASCKLVFDTTPGYGTVTVLTCYKEELAEKGINIQFVSPKQLALNDKVMVFDSINKQLVARYYLVDTLQHINYCNADILYVKAVKAKI